MRAGYGTELHDGPDTDPWACNRPGAGPGLAPIVLVGHSYGGAVITNAATGNTNVKALVYVDAFLPAQGETLGELLGTPPGSCVLGPPTEIFDLRPIPGAPPGVVDAYVKQRLFPSCFANDLAANRRPSWPPPSGPSRPSPSLSRPGHRPGPRFRPGRWSAPLTG